MQRNPVNSIDTNNDLKISCEITAENYKNIIISYNSASKNKPLSINDYEITTEELVKNKNWKIFPSTALKNILEIYFTKDISKECDCGICYEAMKESIIMLPTASMLCVPCTNEHIEVYKKNTDPFSNEVFTHLLQINLIPYLLEQKNKPQPGSDNLHVAISNNDNNLLAKYLIERKYDLDLKNSKGKTALQLAFEMNNAVAIRLLLVSCATPDYMALMNAVDSGKWDLVFSFIDNNAEFNLNNNCIEIYRNVLLKAAHANQMKVVQFLLEKNIAPTCVYESNDANFGYGAIHFAVWHKDNHHEMLKLLLDTNNDKVKADPNLQHKKDNKISRSPLELALERDDAEAVEILLKNGAKPNYTALENAIKNNRINAACAFMIFNPDKVLSDDQIEELIKFRVNFEKSINGETPLQLALTQNNADAVGLLLQNKAASDLKAFSKAVDEKKWEAVNSYIQFNPDSFYCANSIYKEVMVKAAQENQYKTVKLLLEKNIVPESSNNNGLSLSPLEYALKNNNAEITAILLNNNNYKASSDYPAFTKAVNANFWKSATAYILNNKIINFSNLHQETKKHYHAAILKAVAALPNDDAEKFIEGYIKSEYLTWEFCIKNPEINLLEKLCIYKPGIDLTKGEYSSSSTPLQLAIELTNTTAIAFLLKKGVPLNYDAFKSVLNNTYKPPAIPAIISCVENNNDEMAGVWYSNIDALYLASKTYFSKKESWEKLKSAFIKAGCCALHLAIENNKSDDIEILIEKGMNVNERNENGLTPLALAFQKNDAKAVGLLIKKGATPDYKLFKKVVAENKWDVVCEFVTNNPDEKSYECVNAYPAALLAAAIANKLDVVTVLINRHAGMSESIADYKSKNNGWYAIHFAVLHLNHDMLRFLLKNNANPDTRCNFKPLQLAMQKDDPVATELLLTHGAEANYKFFDEAVDNKCWKAAAAFVKSCKDKKISNLLSQTFEKAIDLAIKQNQNKFIETFIDTGLLTIEFAIQYEQTILLVHWIAKNPKVKAVYILGESAIQFAISKNKPEAVALLLQHGMTPDYHALNIAIKNKKWNVAIAFVKNNTDPDAAKNYGFLSSLIFISESNELKTRLLCAGCSQIYSAVQQKNNVELKKLLENKYNPNERNFDNQQFPLELAFQTDNAEAVALLLQYGALCNYNDFKNAFIKGKWNLAIEFVKYNKFYVSRPEAFKDIYDRAMTVAGYDNQVELIRCLLETNVISPHIINMTFKTVLLNNNVKATALLLSAKADVDDLILITAITNNRWEAATLLITHKNISHEVIYKTILTALDKNQIEFIDTCLDAGLFSLKDAIRSGRIELLKRYHSKNEIDFNVNLEKNKTLLQYAFEMNNPDHAIFTFLLENGVKPDYNAFIFAIQSGYSNSACAFVNANFDNVAHAEYSAINALFLAKSSKLEDLVTVMINAGCNAIHDAVLDNNIEVLQKLLNNKINPDQGDVAGRTPLQVAIESGKTEVIDFLLLYKINQNKKLGNILINYALNYAIQTNAYKAFEYVLKYFKISSDDINFLLEHSFEMPMPNINIIRLLVENGAELNFDILKNALKNKNMNAATAFINENQLTLANPECKKAYSESLNMIINLPNKPAPVFNALLPVLFLQLTSECRQSIKNETKGQLVELYIDKFANQKFAFNDDDHIKDMLKKIICIFMQREEFQFFSSTSSSEQLCKILLKPEYKYFLKLICGNEYKQELTYDDLLAFVTNNSNDTAIFTYQKKDENYESYKPGKK